MIDLESYIKDNNLTKKMVSDVMGISPQYLSAILSGKRPINEEKLQRLVNHFGESILEYKQPDIVIDVKNNSQEIDHTNNKVEKGVPYYEDLDVTASVISALTDYKEIPTFYINYKHFNDCDAYVPVTGDSMYPKYCAGEIVAVKRIMNFNALLWGETHLVITNDNANNYRTIKDIHPHEDDSKIILRSSNPNYRGDTVVSKEDVLSIYIVKGRIKRNQL